MCFFLGVSIISTILLSRFAVACDLLPRYKSWTEREREREGGGIICITISLRRIIETVSLCMCFFLGFSIISTIFLSRFAVACGLLSPVTQSKNLHTYNLRSSILILNERTIARAGQHGCTSGPIWVHELANMDFAREGLYGERNHKPYSTAYPRYLLLYLVIHVTSLKT